MSASARPEKFSGVWLTFGDTLTMSMSVYEYELEHFVVMLPFNMTLEQHLSGAMSIQGRAPDYLCRNVIVNHLLNQGLIIPFKKH